MDEEADSGTESDLDEEQVDVALQSVQDVTERRRFHYGRFAEEAQEARVRHQQEVDSGSDDSAYDHAQKVQRKPGVWNGYSSMSEMEYAREENALYLARLRRRRDVRSSSNVEIVHDTDAACESDELIDGAFPEPM